MKIVVNLIYEGDDHVSCPDRKRFEDKVEFLLTDYVGCLETSVNDVEVTCFSCNLKEDQYVQKKKN